MSERKKTALRGTVGQLLVQFALYHQDVNDANKLLKNDEDVDENNVDITKNQNVIKNLTWQ